MCTDLTLPPSLRHAAVPMRRGRPTPSSMCLGQKRPRRWRLFQRLCWRGVVRVRWHWSVGNALVMQMCAGRLVLWYDSRPGCEGHRDQSPEQRCLPAAPTVSPLLAALHATFLRAWFAILRRCVYCLWFCESVWCRVLPPTCLSLPPLSLSPPSRRLPPSLPRGPLPVAWVWVVVGRGCGWVGEGRGHPLRVSVWQQRGRARAVCGEEGGGGGAAEVQRPAPDVARVNRR